MCYETAQHQAGLRTRLHPDPCFGGEKPPRSWVGAGCRQDPAAKQEANEVASSPTPPPPKPNQTQKKKNSSSLTSAPPSSTPGPDGNAQEHKPHSTSDPKGVWGRVLCRDVGHTKRGQPPRADPAGRCCPDRGGLAPCPRHYRHSSAIGRGSRAAWVRPRARFLGCRGLGGRLAGLGRVSACRKQAAGLGGGGGLAPRPGSPRDL